MKRIYFDNLNNRKRYILLIIGLILIIIGFLDKIYGFNINSDLIKTVKLAGFLLVAIHYFNIILKKNYFGWSKNGMIIKINNFIREYRISYNEIKSYELKNGILTIIKSNGKSEFDLTKIEQIDIEKMIIILNENTVANNV